MADKKKKKKLTKAKVAQRSKPAAAPARAMAATHAQLAAYASQCTDAHADELGAETKSGNVLREARALVREAQPALRSHAAAVPYGAARVGYLVGLLGELEADIASQSHGHDAAKSTQSAVDASEATARTQRTWLFNALDKVAVGDADGAARVHAARGSAGNTPEGIAESLHAGVRLARAWLHTANTGWPELLDDRHVTPAALDTAERAAAALTAAVERKSGARSHGDSPAVNRIEGRVLFECERLYGALEEARASGSALVLPKLGPTLRRVVLRGRHRTAQRAPSGGSPAPSNGSSAPAATDHAAGAP